MSALARVSTVEFYGDRLQVVGETREEAAVVLRPACEALGLDPDSQRKRLAAAPWATTVITTAVAADGKEREVFCISLDTLPMWLATIDAGRVRPGAREKLERYQREAAKVLAAHFLRPAAPPTADALALALVERLVPAIAAATAHAVGQQLAAAQARAFVEGNGIGGHGARRVSSTLTSHAKALTRSDPKRYRSQRGIDETSLRSTFGFAGTGRAWARFPLADWPHLLARLDELDREAQRLTAGVQLELLPAHPTTLPAT